MIRECTLWSPGNDSLCFKGLTVNISRSGALVEVERGGPMLAPGHAMHLELPLAANGNFGPKCLYFRGTEVRTTSSTGYLCYVALSFDSVMVRELRAEPGRGYSEMVV
jgi:hypothetical protein